MDPKLIFLYVMLGAMAVCMAGSLISRYRNAPARQELIAEHKRKLKYHTVARGTVNIKSGWIWSDRVIHHSLMVIFQENGYGDRRVLCEDSDVEKFPPIREWLDGGDTATLEQQMKRAA